MRKIIVFMGFLVLLMGCSSSRVPVKPNQPEWGEVINGLQSRISSRNRQLVVGEVPTLVFELRNLTENEVFTSDFSGKQIDYDELRVEHQSSRHSGSIPFPLARTDFGRKPGHRLRIAPGETISAEVNIVPQSEEDKSWLWQILGTYTLQWKLSKPGVGEDLENPLVSNLLTIEVVSEVVRPK